jgi:hypothetical protein
MHQDINSMTEIIKKEHCLIDPYFYQQFKVICLYTLDGGEKNGLYRICRGK